MTFNKALLTVVSLLVLLAIGYMLLMTVLEVPTYGGEFNPVHNSVKEHYLEKGIEEIGGHNLVANVIVGYRGYDTLVEVAVLFTSIVAITIALKSNKEEEDDNDAIHY